MDHATIMAIAQIVGQLMGGSKKQIAITQPAKPQSIQIPQFDGSETGVPKVMSQFPYWLSQMQNTWGQSPIRIPSQNKNPMLELILQMFQNRS